MSDNSNEINDERQALGPEESSEQNVEAPADADKSADSAENTSDDEEYIIETEEIAKALEKALNENTQFQDQEPFQLLGYIENYVTIKLEKDVSYEGFVHSIDPVSHSIILSVPKDDGNFQTVLIPGNAVVEIAVTHCNDISVKPPERKQISGILSDEVQLRKRKIISWLKENHLEVKEDRENVHFGGIILLPPYEDKDICTSNVVVALEIKKLIGRMPADYEPK